MRALVYHGPGRLESRIGPPPCPTVARSWCGCWPRDLRHGPAHRQGCAPRVPGGHPPRARARDRRRGGGHRGGRGRHGGRRPRLRRAEPRLRPLPACRAGRVNLCADAAAFGSRSTARSPSTCTCRRLRRRREPDERPAGRRPGRAVRRGAAGLRPARQRAVALGEGDAVLVCGAGPIGLLHVLLARAAGARAVIVSEPHPRRRADAAEFGATAGVDPDGGSPRARARGHRRSRRRRGHHRRARAGRPGTVARARRGRWPDQLLRRPAQGCVEDLDRLQRRALPRAHAHRDDGERHRRLPARARAGDVGARSISAASSRRGSRSTRPATRSRRPAPASSSRS